MLDEEQQLIAKLRKIEGLFARPAQKVSHALRKCLESDSGPQFIWPRQAG